MTIRILLVEDEPLWQVGIRALLETAPDMTLLSVVDNADDAEVFAQAERPDVALLDWKINGPRDGLELAQSLQAFMPPERLILVTGSPAEQIPPHPYGYVPKPKIVEALLETIRLVCKDL